MYSGSGTRREASFFTVYRKQEKIQRIHAPLIRARGHAERSYFIYCSPKTREVTTNTRAVYSGSGTRGEKLLSLLSTKNKRRYSEHTRHVFWFGDARREATCFTVYQNQGIYSQCTRCVFMYRYPILIHVLNVYVPLLKQGPIWGYSLGTSLETFFLKIPRRCFTLNSKFCWKMSKSPKRHEKRQRF